MGRGGGGECPAIGMPSSFRRSFCFCFQSADNAINLPQKCRFLGAQTIKIDNTIRAGHRDLRSTRTEGQVFGRPRAIAEVEDVVGVLDIDNLDSKLTT